MIFSPFFIPSYRPVFSEYLKKAVIFVLFTPKIIGGYLSNIIIGFNLNMLLYAWGNDRFSNFTHTGFESGVACDAFVSGVICVFTLEKKLGLGVSKSVMLLLYN